MNLVNTLLAVAGTLYVVGAVLLAYVFIPRRRNR